MQMLKSFSKRTRNTVFATLFMLIGGSLHIYQIHTSKESKIRVKYILENNNAKSIAGDIYTISPDFFPLYSDYDTDEIGYKIKSKNEFFRIGFKTISGDSSRICRIILYKEGSFIQAEDWCNGAKY